MDTTKNVIANSFPPVVSVLGHVDHGKTTLLDSFRKTNVANGEAGGITQSIGASQIEIDHEGKKRDITFIDTPGHEAFSNMRSHGVSASDVVLLIVAADDGVMPQTKESIEKIKASKLPFIAVITKIDAPGVQIEKVKQQLLKEEILLEGLGGDVPYIGVSAKTGEKIRDLLELILIVYDVSDIKKSEKNDFLGVVIEAKIDKRRGVLASVVVKEGKLSVGQKIYQGQKEVGKVRALVDTYGKNVKEAIPGDAIEILGIVEVLSAGSLLFTKPTAEEKIVSAALIERAPADLMQLLAREQEERVKVILKTQTSGEFEAVSANLPKDVEVAFEGRGDINVSDILMARDFNAIVVGFNVSIEKQAKTLAENQNTFYRTYSIIYNLIDELNDAVLLLQEKAQRKIHGKAQILATFEGKEGTILGVKVQEGKLSKGDKIVVTRGATETPEAKIISLKQGKQDVKEVGKGNECGIMLEPLVDFTVGDMIISCS